MYILNYFSLFFFALLSVISGSPKNVTESEGGNEKQISKWSLIEKALSQKFTSIKDLEVTNSFIHFKKLVDFVG